MTFVIQISYGKEKYKLEIPNPDSTLEELGSKIFEVTGIPRNSQKIIFKGKTLKDYGKSLAELKVGPNSKMLLLGKKDDGSVESSSKEIDRIVRAVDALESKMVAVEQELDGIEKGFLQRELVEKACQGLRKRCVNHSELLVQKMEQHDAIDIPLSEVMLRTRRKTAIQRIQRLLSRNDCLMARLDQCRTKTP